MRPSFRPPEEVPYCPYDCPYRENDGADVYGCDDGCKLRESEETEARNERDDRRYHTMKDDEMTEGKERR